MFIYKITNTVNGKVYIGQVYNKSVRARFVRHIHDASPNSRSYIDRAIFKYGKDAFVVETIDTATSTKELSEKEKYWIKYYNSTDLSIGYNLTEGGDGGNTYLNKTPEEMKGISEKISASKAGSLNPNAKGIKCLNTQTNEEYFFDTLVAALAFFGVKNKAIISQRCDGKLTGLYKGVWNFAWEGDEYKERNVFDSSTRKGSSVRLISKETGDVREFPSINRMAAHLGMRVGTPLSTIKKRVGDKYIIETVC